ncbi:peptidase B [Variibacter gotjawalensis]|uniref:Peptidase B n=1 Tax=Variibacter gotjawalensis TaxID=1333996 RepID=A0A0S3PPI9_9BRAD|nr:leucyl aminopeptidase family protein [Variibacter gotjawalensis]NIK48101.1 leucyl aminopeptidase [Variibacter gotjawalensis]RZS49977.1 leucyl aminopeptidase [Variibacter gotjawalensis]BAT57804.1 peptidase B [Variibacter gotjawalensis]
MNQVIAASSESADAIPIWFVTKASYAKVAEGLDPAERRFAETSGFRPMPGQFLVLPDRRGNVSGVLFGDSAEATSRFLAGKLPTVLPAGVYRFANRAQDTRLAALAFVLGSYRFGRYRKNIKDSGVKLVPPRGVDRREISRIAEGVFLARDLVNTPANDMGPAELAEVALKLAEQHGAKARVIEGDDLLAQNFPLVHAVGRASTRAPRLIDITWGNPKAPKVTLVGKGVCFDTGGLDLKPSSAMLIMKKDMGGAASVLAAAHMIMDRGLDVRLRVLIPAVENAVGGDAFRPLDIVPSRKGLNVEIGNTDAEGRLVLADALALADEEKPDLLIDMGTLTGAARVALGPDLPPFYTADDKLAADVARHAEGESDPVWRLPLWRPYDAMLDSKIADLNNVSSGPFAGSIICALFLQRFVSAAKSWLHFDIYGWNPSTRPGRPEGGECQAARAVYALLCERYGRGDSG